LEEELPERMCILTREVKDPEALIRFVRDPDGKAVPDLAQKLPGRGVWVSADSASVAQVIERRLFNRGFKAETRADIALIDQVEALLRKYALQFLSLASKAGLVVAGHDKVDEWAGKGRLRLLIEASDGAEGGLGRLRRKALGVKPQGVDVISSFTSSELGLALGRTNVIHAAVAEGGLAEKLCRAARRLEAYKARPEEKA
jgi:uncharacterized protein